MAQYKPPTWADVYNPQQGGNQTAQEVAQSLASFRAQQAKDSDAATYRNLSDWENSPESYTAFKAWESSQAQRAAREAKANS